MRYVCLGLVFAATGFAGSIYNNLTPNDLIGIATSPGTPGTAEVETGDDFFLGSQTIINSASFVGIVVPGTGGTPSITDVVAEIYRVFPFDSDTVRTPKVTTRANSPSDVAFDSRDSAASDFTFTTSILATSFTALNSVQPGGIHPDPGEHTGGNGPLTGQEVQIDITFTNPFNLPTNHYFFVPQVELSNGGQFYWLSASRPISGAGTTPFPVGVTDLQAWTRDANLDPDWLRVGADIVGGTTFNTAFSLDGITVPEPATPVAVFVGLVAIGLARRYQRTCGNPRST